MKIIFKKFWFKPGLVILLLAMLCWAVRFFEIDFSRVTVESFKAKMLSFGVWGPVIYVVLYLARPLIFFPASILSAAAGAIWGLQGFLYLQVAANLSAVAEFLAARYLARDLAERLIQGRFSRIDEAMEKRGFITVLLIRLIPNVAWDIQNLGLGLTRVKFRDYFLATAVGIVPGSLAVVYFGSSLISVITNPGHFWKIFIAILFLGLIYFLQDFLKRRRDRI